MEEAIKFLSGQPPWLATPIILVTLFVALWPKILQVIHDLNAENRVYQNEKRRLELLKLRYEIEVIKKSNELDALDVEHELLPVAQVPAVDSTPNSLTQTGPKRYLSVWHRAALGALGAFLPSLYRIVILILTASMKDMHWYMHFLNVGFFTGILFLCIIGGVVASLIPKERATTALCVLVGISIVLFLQLGVMTFQEMTPPQMESKQLS